MTSLVHYSGTSSDESEEADNSPASDNNMRKRTLSGSGTTLLDRQSHPETRESESSKNLEKQPEIKIRKILNTEKDLCKKAKFNLQLPGEILGMFGASTDTDSRLKGNNPSEHGGRIRSFPHVEGNWASYVFIAVEQDARLKSLIEQLLLCLRPLPCQAMEDLHVSLSRTVAIRHHWITPLVDSLKASFTKMDSCLCDIGRLKIYTNDEKTRTFISIEINAEDTNLVEYTAAVDTSFKDFNLPSFYKDPSFHISLVWCVGDVASEMSKHSQKLQELLDDFLSSHQDLSVISVDKVYLKTGKKEFAFSLQNTVD